jgi:hypothetical protein
MARSTAEYVLGRVLAYLRWHGVTVNSDTTRMAFRLVEQALADGDADLPHRVMEALPRHIALPEVQLPQAALPIKRISLGYAPYL